MAEPERYVHLLTRIGQGKSASWYAPAELADEAPQSGSYVVPVDASGNFYSSYACDVVEYHGAGQQGAPIRCALVFQGNRTFSLRVNTTTLTFRERPTSGRPRALPYRGRLTHPDFAHHLVEIEPKEKDALEKFLAQEKLMVIGCTAFAHYGGLNRTGHGLQPVSNSSNKPLPARPSDE
jgi:hypothetical protein